MNGTTLRVRIAAALLAIGAVAAVQAADLQPYAKKGKVVQRLKAFDNPEGAIFSADGRYVFVSNSAELGMPDKGFHWTHKGGYISKLGEGSAAAKASGVVATLANALAFDPTGNLYLADTGIAGGLFNPPIATKGGGVYLFPTSSLDALAEGRDAPVSYIAAPDGGPDGIEVAPDGMIHFNTVGVAAGLKDPAEGGMYKVKKADFAAGKLPEPFNHGLGALDGLDFAGNNRLDTEIKNTNSVLVTPLSGTKSFMLTYDQDIKLAGPADIAVRKLSDGSYLLVIPELSATSPNSKDNPVTVIRLPADF